MTAPSDESRGAPAALPAARVAPAEEPIAPAEHPAPTADEHAPTTRPNIRRLFAAPIWVDALLPTILLRGVILAFGVLTVSIFRPDALPSGSLFESWNRWDAPHFFEIAQHGYGPPAEPARIVLFPVLPALIAIGSLVTTHLAAGMAIAFGSTLVAAAGLYRLVRLDQGRQAARGAVLAMSIFPTAFTLVAPYSEGPFLAFTVWAFVAARRGQWGWAGILTGLAGATRIQGAFIIPALVVEYWLAKRRIDRDAVWLLPAFGGPLVYLAINVVTFGDPLYFLEIQREVFRVGTVAPWTNILNMADAVGRPAAGEFWATVYLAPFVALTVLGLTTVWAALGRAGRASYAVYAGLSLLSFATLSWPISVPRYAMGVFPIFLLMGRLWRYPWAGPPVFVASALLLAVTTTLFVIGHWAF